MNADVSSKRARAIADLSTGTILASVEIAVPPERVFQAITAGDEIVRWWGSADTYRTTRWEADLRPGGRWTAGGVGADGHAFTVEGEFVEVDPPRRVVQTWKPEWDGGHVTTITYRLEAIPGGTRLIVRHDGFAGRPESCAGHSQGWERVLDWLLDHLRAKAPAPAPALYFLSRLIPPRPTFPAGLTPEEAKVMHEHIAYWTELMKQGKAIVFGPVADPAGNFGIGVLRVKDQAELQRLVEADPAAKSGLGFKHVNHPMPQVVHA